MFSFRLFLLLSEAQYTGLRQRRLPAEMFARWRTRLQLVGGQKTNKKTFQDLYMGSYKKKSMFSLSKANLV